MVAARFTFGESKTSPVTLDASGDLSKNAIAWAAPVL